MTIQQLIEQGKGRAHNWRVVEDNDNPAVKHLYHYSTNMLTWNHITKEIIDYDLGWGSVSDQNGMNIAFRVLGSKLYFSRNGGAAILD